MPAVPRKAAALIMTREYARWLLIGEIRDLFPAYQLDMTDPAVLKVRV